MDSVSRLAETVFRDPSNPDVEKFTKLLKRMAVDYSLGVVDDYTVRDFLYRHRTYLRILIENHSKVTIEVDHFIDMVLKALVEYATTNVSGGINTAYTMTVLRRSLDRE